MRILIIIDSCHVDVLCARPALYRILYVFYCSFYVVVAVLLFKFYFLMDFKSFVGLTEVTSLLSVSISRPALHINLLLTSLLQRT